MFTDDDMDLVFSALAHASRRRILDILRDAPGIPVGKLAAHFDVSRIAVMNHLAVLEDAGLVVSRKQGRSRLLYLNTLPLQDIHNRWTDQFSAHWADRASFIKAAAESAARLSAPQEDDDD